MSPTRIAPTLADSPIDGAPAQDVAHHAPAPFDPQMIAGLANAFFQAPPASVGAGSVRTSGRDAQSSRRARAVRRHHGGAVRAGARATRPA